MTKHKHNWFPTEDVDKINDSLGDLMRWYQLSDDVRKMVTAPEILRYNRRKWICECGKTKWVEEK